MHPCPNKVIKLFYHRVPPCSNWKHPKYFHAFFSMKIWDNRREPTSKHNPCTFSKNMLYSDYVNHILYFIPQISTSRYLYFLFQANACPWPLRPTTTLKDKSFINNLVPIPYSLLQDVMSYVTSSIPVISAPLIHIQALILSANYFHLFQS